MSDKASARGSLKELDLTNEVCPITFVRAKVFLETVAPGEMVVLKVTSGEQVRDIPRSLTAEGHIVKHVMKNGDNFDLYVVKRPANANNQ